MSIFETIESAANNVISKIPFGTEVGQVIDDMYDKIVVSPMEVEGVNNIFIFDIPQSEAVKLSKDITDHWTENGGYINDHAVEKPAEITLSGMVGELADFYKKNTVLGKIGGLARNLNNRLTALGGQLGVLGDDLTPQAQQIAQKILNETQQAAKAAEQIQQRYDNIKNAFTGVTKQSRQQEAYNKLAALYSKGSLLQVATPWIVLKNMTIDEIEFTQDEDTKDITNITIHLKELRISNIKVTKLTPSTPANIVQSAPLIDLGFTEAIPNANMTVVDVIPEGTKNLLRENGIIKQLYGNLL
jgi:hypothetical protein